MLLRNCPLVVVPFFCADEVEEDECALASFSFMKKSSSSTSSGKENEYRQEIPYTLLTKVENCRLSLIMVSSGRILILMMN